MKPGSAGERRERTNTRRGMAFVQFLDSPAVPMTVTFAHFVDSLAGHECAAYSHEQVASRDQRSYREWVRGRHRSASLVLKHPSH